MANENDDKDTRSSARRQDERDWAYLIRQNFGRFRIVSADDSPDEKGAFNGIFRLDDHYEQFPSEICKYSIYPPRPLWQGQVEPKGVVDDLLWTMILLMRSEDEEENEETVTEYVIRGRQIHDLGIPDPFG